VKHRVIAIAGAKGSPGCSFLAVALARCLAANKIPTLLLDGDAEGGGLAAMLDVSPMMPTRKLDTKAIDQAEVRVEEHLWFAEVAQTLDSPANGIEDTISLMRSVIAALVIRLKTSWGPTRGPPIFKAAYCKAGTLQTSRGRHAAVLVNGRPRNWWLISKQERTLIH